jgi:hypothetical protein
LHASHAAANGVDSDIISADDTDVLVLLIGLNDKLSTDIYLRSGSGGKARIFNISKVSKLLGKDVCDALIGLHAFTACDSASAFAGKGKVSAFKLMRKCSKYQKTFMSLGQSWNVHEQLLNDLEMFVCALYGAPTVENVNACRYKLFCAKKGEIDSSQLPPYLDCLGKHACRSNYQAAIWRKRLESCPVIPSPHAHEWIIATLNELPSLDVDWMEDLPAPSAILELLSCNCRSVSGSDCPCIINGLK